MRLIGDPAADALIKQVYQSKTETHLYTYLRLDDEGVRACKQAPDLKNFLLATRPLPAWYDKARISRGQKFFQKYALDIMTLLGAMSLPYCYAASPGNKAIYLTEKMRKAPGKRLLETAHFIIAVMQDDSFEEHGSAGIQINKTRLIHAMVRHHIEASGTWDPEWGLPVNQEDMAGTNLAFSYIILVGLEHAKFPVTSEEKEDFLFTWRYIGYQLHIDKELLAQDFHEAKTLEQAIKTRHFKASEEAKLLTAELIRHYKSSFPALPAYFVDGQIRYFLGKDVSRLLGMNPETFKDAVIKVMNTLKEKINRRYVDPSSYRKMLSNHARLRQKYS